MNTCATCRFWNRNGEPVELYDPYADNGLGDMRKMPHRTCFRIIHGSRYEVRVESLAEMPAFVTDGIIGYTAALRTLPTFGCVAWEAKT
jgi:hypothetical protein